VLDNKEEHIEFRKVIIEAAKKMFATYGFKKTALNDIAKSLNKSKSSLYYYFKSKEDLFKAVIETENQFLIDEIKSKLSSIDDTKEKLKQYILVRFSTVKKLINYYNIRKDEYLLQLPFIENLRQKYLEEELTFVKNILLDGIDKKIFGIKNPEITAYTIIIALKGLEYSWNEKEEMNPKTEDVDNLLDILFYGIIKRKTK